MNASTRALVALIAQREIMARLRDRAFIISSIFLLVLVGASVTLPFLVQGDGSRESLAVVTVGPAAAATARQAASISDAAYRSADSGGSDNGVPQLELRVSAVPDLAAAEAAVRAGTAEAAIVPAGSSSGGSAPALQLLGDRSVSSDVSELVARAQAAQRLEAALSGSGADPADVSAALAPVPVAQRSLNPNADEQGLAIALGFVFAALSFFTVFAFGMSIAQSVVEEKQSRIVELLVTAVPVRVLLLGKVAGNTVLALGQVVLLLAVGLAGASIAGQSELITVLLRSSGWFVVFFVLSFVMLASLWAAAGAMASRQEDLQTTTLPLQMLLMVPFFAAVYIVEPGRWLTILSYVPFTAGLVMPRRLALGDAGPLQALAAAALVVITAVVIVAIGARLYEGGLLRTRTKTSWRDAWSRSS